MSYMNGFKRFDLEKMGHTHKVIVYNTKGSIDTKSFRVCLERTRINEKVFVNRLKKYSMKLHMVMDIIEPLKEHTHSIRISRLREYDNTYKKNNKSYTFSIRIPGYSSGDIARELYKYCMGGRVPEW